MCRGALHKTRVLTAMLALSTLLSGCTSYSSIINKPRTVHPATPAYSIDHAVSASRSGELTLVLAFSGGGTRAAALAYGVLEELRDTRVVIDGRPRRLLDEVDLISSVSGGSFTAAYFGLNGEALFSDFEEAFLRRDVASELVHGLFSPAWWFSSRGRTEMAVDFYEDSVFKGATFADLQQGAGPLIVINASDLGGGVRFSFLQEYFDLLCSDLASFPVARAVTASSAVPMLFTPVALENHAGCERAGRGWVQDAQQHLTGSPQLAQVLDGLQSYADKENRRFIHLVDGGITDNLGLRAIYDIIEVAGGPRRLLRSVGAKPASRLVIVSVNASTRVGSDMEASARAPTLEQTANAVTDIQLHRYNASTVELLQASIQRWAQELSTPAAPVASYFVQVDFEAIAESERQVYFNRIPTSLALSGEQVDQLIAAGRELLRDNVEFRRFVKDLGGEVH